MVLALAVTSALSRAGLNVIDRYQIGLKSSSIRSVNLWNNIVPAAAMIMLAWALGWHQEWIAHFVDWKTFLFAGVAQLVAYAFSYAFRYLSVNQVTVAAKLSDLLIPVGVFLATRYWDWKNFGFSVISTLLCLPILRTRDPMHGQAIRRVGLVLCMVLVLQASVSPLLAQVHGDLHHALLFAIAVMAWRAVWSVLPVLPRLRTLQTPPFGLLFSRAFLVRCLLTVVTQATFILAVGNAVSAVAWPILNTAGLFAMFMASVILREPQARTEKLIVLAITLLAIVRFYL
jgi:drug/metabolite transporter (DMT)-like permease